MGSSGQLKVLRIDQIKGDWPTQGRNIREFWPTEKNWTTQGGEI